MNRTALFLLLFLPLTPSLHSMDDIFAPEDPASDNLAEEVQTTSLFDGAGSNSDPSADFAMFRFELLSNKQVKKHFEKQSAAAGNAFDELIESDTTPDAKLTALLHNMTKDLQLLYGKYHAKGIDKVLAAQKKLRYWVGEIRTLELTNHQVEELSHFVKHFKGVLQHAMKASGIWEQIRALPIATMLTGTVTAAVLYWAVKSQLINNLIQALGSIPAAIQHLLQSEREANRARGAFFKQIEIDETATARNQESDDPEVRDRVEYIHKWDFQARRARFLRKYPHPRPDKSEMAIWQAERARWIRERIQDFDEQRPGWKQYWEVARPGVMERLVDVMTTVAPTIKEAGKMLVRNAHVQKEWFKAHNINANHDMAPVLIGTVTQDHTPTPTDFSLRYISDTILTADQVEQHIERYGKTRYLGQLAIPFLWRNVRKKHPHPYEGWHYTFLPDRNTVEQFITMMRKVNNPHTPIGRTLQGVSLQLETTNRNIDLWLEAIQPPASEDLRSDQERQQYEEAVASGDEVNQVAFRPRYRARWEAFDGRTPEEKKIGKPQPLTDKKRMYYVGYTPGVPHTNENGEALLEGGRPLFRHYPDINILEKLTQAVNKLNDVENPMGNFFYILSVMLENSNAGYARWIEKEGFGTFDSKHVIRLHPNTRRYIDEENNPYMILLDDDGNPRPETKVYEQAASINKLWDTLGALVHNPDAGISQLVRNLGEVTHDVTQDDSKLVGTVNRLIADALRQVKGFTDDYDFYLPGGGLTHQLGYARLGRRTPLEMADLKETDDSGDTPAAPELTPEEQAEKAQATIDAINKALIPMLERQKQLEKQSVGLIKKVAWKLEPGFLEPEKFHKKRLATKERRIEATNRHAQVTSKIDEMRQNRGRAFFLLHEAQEEILRRKEKELNDDAGTVDDAESVALAPEVR